jgi:manganese transport protein
LFAATFGAACETGLSVGYSVAQYFGWQWGKYVRPREAARFHVVLLLAAITGVAVLLTTVDPIKVTEYSVVFSAVALPLTYFPILVVANDADYMGRQSQRRANRSLEAVRRGLDHRRAYGERRASVEHLDCGGELRAARHL